RESRDPLLKLDQRPVARVGLCLVNDLTSPVVPLPHKPRIPGECFRGRKLLWRVVAPQAARAAKSRDTRLGRYPGTGEHNERGCGAERFTQAAGASQGLRCRSEVSHRTKWWDHKSLGSGH